MNPFDVVNDISNNKKYILENEKDYSPFMVNKALSYYSDTILYANEMNLYSDLDNRLQYDFLFHAIPKRKRFSKWSKPDINQDIYLIQEYYKYSLERAKEVYTLLSKEQINELKQLMDKGGTHGR